MIKRLLGDNHPEVVTSLDNLAALYKIQVRYSEAELLPRQALEITKSLLEGNNSNVVTDFDYFELLKKIQGQNSGTTLLM